jgi:hypothetical protein
VIVAVLTTMVAGAAPAQEAISTDRPGLGFGTSVVPRGSLQLEMGLPEVETTREGDVRQRLITFPGLLRYGVGDNVELRLGLPVLNLMRTATATGAGTAEGFGPVEVGAKLGFTVGAAGPELALIPSVTLPVGEREFAGDRAAFSLTGVAAWSLPAELELTAVGGVGMDPDGESDHTTVGTLVGVLGRSLTPRSGGYVEAAWYPTPEVRDPVLVGVGAMYLLTSTVQLDAFVNRGLNPAAPDWLFGAGVSVRF